MSVMTRSIEEPIRVLFIERDPSVAEMYKLKLELDGYQVMVVAHDEQVEARALAVKPDMVYLDLRLGEAEGIATLEGLRAAESTRNLPIIILSSYAANEMASRGFEAHLLDYVVRADPGPGALTWNLQDWARTQAS
jgi:DNA-binding response OmpR family regulator